ncbi:MAG: hypothetical protein IT319_16595, partial [Anaerolineae bacterium]|nr:hypothetical protein [Anaerolineae bacterium]
VTAIGALRLRDLRRQPVTLFFFAAHALALALFAYWFVRWGGFPQFSELGWL